MTSTLLAIDAMSVAYRAFHAIADLSTAAGRPTNAVYGFVKTVGHVRRIWNPSHCLVVFDGGAPRARLDLLKEYKAQRPPMPPTLKEQIPAIEEYLDCARIQHARMEGEEADDVMASIAVRAEKTGMSSLIMTGDKDLMQVVDDRISIISPGKADVAMGPAQVKEKTGVLPGQIVDWLALVGDSSDNIPGVPGVGAKTAARWLDEWGSLDSVLRHLDSLKPEKPRAALAGSGETVKRNLLMMKLDLELDCGVAIDDMKCACPDEARLLRFYETMEFHSLASDLRAPRLL
jgi:DNA polymerase-1